MTNPNGSHWIRTSKRRRIYARDGWRCVWCEQPVEQGRNATLDHFLAREAGGTNATDNLLTACFRCNSRRQHKPALLFAFDLGSLWIVQTMDRVLDALDRPLPPDPDQ
jgi:5-methylcytosine-specific restriction endonuclease McrA